MDTNYIHLNAPNIITISIAGLLGYGLLVGSTLLYKKLTNKNGS
jgi:hypothetical protein